MPQQEDRRPGNGGNDNNRLIITSKHQDQNNGVKNKCMQLKAVYNLSRFPQCVTELPLALLIGKWGEREGGGCLPLRGRPNNEISGFNLDCAQLCRNCGPQCCWAVTQEECGHQKDGRVAGCWPHLFIKPKQLGSRLVWH